MPAYLALALQLYPPPPDTPPEGEGTQMHAPPLEGFVHRAHDQGGSVSSDWSQEGL